MGNLYSSLPVVNPARSGNYEEVEEDDCSSNPSTPFPEAAGATEGKLRALTALIDPRSPTVGVSRTPVEVVAEREKIRQEMVRKLQALEVPGGGSGGGVQTGGKTPESLPSSNTGWDPRSPTLEYNRTPLALGEKKANIMANNAGGVKNEDSCEGDSNVIEDVDVIGKKLQDAEISSGGGKMCRDLRKRLFVEKINESLAAADENKEN